MLGISFHKVAKQDSQVLGFTLILAERASANYLVGCVPHFFRAQTHGRPLSPALPATGLRHEQQRAAEQAAAACVQTFGGRHQQLQPHGLEAL